MTALAARRRHPMASAALVLLGLLVTGVLYALAVPGRAAAAPGATQDVTAGKQLFLANCSTCHGVNAEGRANAPSLVGVGAAAVDFQVATGRMPLQASGPQAPAQKNIRYTEDEIGQLAAYVASLGPGPSIPSEEDLDVSKASNEDIVEGGKFFRTNCTACHNFAGTGGALPGGKFAPSLIGVSEKHLFEAMLTGPQQMPVFADGVLSADDKRQIIAYLKKQEDSPDYGGFSLGSIGPVSEGMFAWLFGIGGLVGAGIWITAGSARSNKKTTTKGADA